MKIRSAEAACLLLLGGCAITPAPVSTSPNDPSNPQAAEAASKPFHPALVKGAKTYLAADTGADAEQMHHDMNGIQGMSGMNPEQMKAMPGMAGPPRNPSEKATIDSEKSNPSATPTSEHLQGVRASEYTCRLHPEIHSDKPGKCPKCGRTLVTRESLRKSNAKEAKQP